MRETVSIHVGQAGNQIGNQFWNLLLHEHEKTPDDDPALSAFFHFERSKHSNEKVMKARALLIDMECGPLQETMASNLGSLFNDTQFIYDVSGAGNNFAHGHYGYGPQYRERLEEGFRRNAENCESLQTYLVTHSLGGGTGSGMGTYVLSLLDELYPKIYRFSACVYPSEDSDVVTAPYNTILATNELIEHADCVFPLDNTALFKFAAAEKTTQLSTKESSGNTQNSTTETKQKKRDRGYNEINNICARMLCHLTSSARFHGEMNVDLNEIYTNLIPFPKLHFPMTSLSLRVNIPKSRTSTGLITSNNTIRTNDSSRVILQRAFDDILKSRGQITAACPTERGCITLASAFLARGKVPLSDFLNCVSDAQSKLRFPDWNPDACKIGMCSTPSPSEESSVLGVYNSTSFGTVLTRELSGFLKLFRCKAMLHHYTEFVAESEIAKAEESVQSVINDYSDLQSGTFPNTNRTTQSNGNSNSNGYNTNNNRMESGNRSGSISSRRREVDGSEYNTIHNSDNAVNVWSDPRFQQLFPSF